MKPLTQTPRVIFPSLVVAVTFLLTLFSIRGETHSLEIVDCIDPVPEDTQAPLLSGLGETAITIVTRGPNAKQAQRYFNQGIALLYGFNHPEALHSFAQAAHFDPAAPMAQWGIAMAAGPDINTGATQGCYKLAMSAISSAVEKAQAQLENKSVDSSDAQRELAYAKALAARYSKNSQGEFSADARAYADAMAEVTTRYPDDLDAATLYSAALMNVNPWKWWKDSKPTPEAAEARDVLRRVIAQNSSHLGANHYYIHATEESPWPEEAMASANRLMELAPGAGHIQHMPAHIFRRTGDHARATEANYAAVAVDHAYIHQTPATARYPLHYLSHNQHFLTVSLTIEGRESEAIASATQLFELVTEYADDTYNELYNQTLADVKNDFFFAVPIQTAVRFSRWDVLAQFEQQEAAGRLIELRKLAFTSAIWNYARVLESLDRKDPQIDKVLLALGAFWTAVDQAPADLTYGTNHAADLFRVANLSLLARITESVRDEQLPEVIREARTKLANSSNLKQSLEFLKNENRPQLVIDLWSRAVAQQDELAYNEPSDWYYPVRESLGAALFRQSRFTEAEVVFREYLKRHRGSGRALFGLIETLKAQGKPVPDWLQENYRHAWRNATQTLSLARM